MRRVPPAASAAACSLVVAVSAAFGPALAAPTIEAHDVTVRLSPAEARIDVVDKVTLRRDGGGKLQFSLGRGDLEIASATMDGQTTTPERLAAFTDGSAMWAIDVPAGRSARVEMVLTYSGAVHAAPVAASAPPDSPAAPAAAIGPAGAALSDDSRWTASDGSPARYTVTTWPVPGWEIVTQGTRTAPAAPDQPTVWTGKLPADGLSLVGGPWKVVRRTIGGVEIGCFVGESSTAAADAVLAAAARHLATYDALFGPFPFDRLDVVETSLATGRGIPGIAFVTKDAVGAIVANAQQAGSTSPRDFEREIVRGWWGHAVLAPNGDGAESGDWTAALTTYCTEVVARETDDPAAAASVRDRMCADFARQISLVNDAPLRAFRARETMADEALVCGKGAMFFHAQRREVGDAAFWDALRRVAAERRGLRTSWADLRTAFEASSKRRLGEFVEQGLDRTGAPLLELTQTQIRTDGGRLRVTGVLRQRLGKRADGSPEKPWRLAVPLVVEHLEGEEETVVDISSEESPFALTVPSIPQRILVDPAHHVFRLPGESPSMTTRLLLPDLKSATSPERAQHVVDVLAAPQMKGRLAGSPEDAKARQFVMDELRLAGIEPSEVPVTFTVKHIDPARAALTQAGATEVGGAVPLVASPETPEDGVSVIGSVTDEDADLAGRALVIDIGADPERPLEFLRDVAKLAVSRGAAALFVRMPATADAPVADLWAFPETLREGVVSRLDEARARGGDGDAVRHAAMTAARTGSDVELPLPTLAVPHGFKPAKDVILKVAVRFRKDEIRTANVVGRMKARGPRRTGTVVLGAHLDHLGAGFPGAGPASGVAALLEAVQVLSAQADLLARDVTVVVFGGEAWGLRGSRAFVAGLPANHDVAAMIDADTAGRRGAGSVSVLGKSAHPRLGRAVATAVAQSLLDAGPEIDAAAYPWGGASWSFHRRGIPSVTLSARDASAPVPTGDTADGVDPANVARMGRAMALSALAVAGGW